MCAVRKTYSLQNILLTHPGNSFACFFPSVSHPLETVLLAFSLQCHSPYEVDPYLFVLTANELFPKWVCLVENICQHMKRSIHLSQTIGSS